MTPNNFQKRILLCVTGMSPQIVTETLYALVTEQGFTPTEIRLITTTRGRNHVTNGLLNDQNGHFHNFCREYHLEGKIRFDESCIDVITDRHGTPLDDIRTLEENTLAADRIVSTVRQICQEPDCALHVSMAGGRKTMGFYIGYALSLFAREQDRLSHVLVSEQYENCRDFYFPSQSPYLLTLDNGMQVDTRNAEVILANIPLVRLRSCLPKSFLTTGNYSDTVHALQDNLPSEMRFDIESRTVQFHGHQPIKLEASQFALLLWLGNRKKQELPAIVPDEDVAGILFQEYLTYYAQVVTVDSVAYGNLVEKSTEARMKQAAKIFQNSNPQSNENIRFLKKYLASRISKIKKAVGDEMGETFSDLFLSPQKGSYSISLLPEAIILPANRRKTKI
mgnify:CR=1 FL=1